MKSNTFRFSAFLINEEGIYVAVCPDLDVVSEGITKDEAKDNLLEAVVLYIETAIESNLPVLRPVPADCDPRITKPETITEYFPVHIDCRVKAYA